MQSAHIAGLVSNPREWMRNMTPSKAYSTGMSLSMALKGARYNVKVVLLAELERLVRHVQATRTFRDQDDLQDCVDDICELYPSMKLEEILTAFKHIRQGRYQLYGNFTTNVLLECIRVYELQNTVTMREEEHMQRKNEVNTASFDVKRLIRDLEMDGLLQAPRKVLDRKFIPYPNDKEDYYSEEQTAEKAKKTPRPKSNE